jgi:hypothetical protein
MARTRKHIYESTPPKREGAKQARPAVDPEHERRVEDMISEIKRLLDPEFVKKVRKDFKKEQMPKLVTNFFYEVAKDKKVREIKEKRAKERFESAQRRGETSPPSDAERSEPPADDGQPGVDKWRPQEIDSNKFKPDWRINRKA